MKRTMGLLLCPLIIFLSCAASPAPSRNSARPEYRPAFHAGDQVSVLGGEYAQAVGTVVEVDVEADVYRVRLADRPNPVFIRSYLLRKYAGSAPLAPRPQPEAPRTPVQAAAVPVAVVPVIPAAPPPAPAPVAAVPEKKGMGRLAILPIIGLEEYVAETLAWHLANEDAIHSNFSVVPITPQIRKNVMSEESYSAIYNAGEDVNADLIMTSFARVIGCQKIIMTLVIDVHTQEQIAGDFRKYDDVQDIPALFPPMTRKIMGVIQKRQEKAPRLSVELMATPPGTHLRNEAAILTQLFAITMANTGAYHVFPRTDDIDAAMLDYETRRTTARKIFVTKEEVTPAEFVLSSKIDTFDTRNQILAEIVDIGNNVLRKGAYINFEIIEDTPELLSRLAAQVSGVTKRE